MTTGEAPEDLAEQVANIAHAHAQKLVITLVDLVLKLPDEQLREGLNDLKRTSYADLVKMGTKS